MKSPINFKLVPQDSGFNVIVDNPNAGNGRATTGGATDLASAKTLLHSAVDAITDTPSEPAPTPKATA